MEHPFKDIKKILVIKLRHIGDVLLTVPVFRALKETFPNARISALVNKGTEDVLTGNPIIEEIITFDRGIKKAPFLRRYLREVGFLRNIIQRRFDMTIDLTGGDRGAITSFLSRARYRIGWESQKGFIGKKHLYTHLFKPDGRRHMVLQNLDVIRSFGISTDNLSMEIFIPDDARNLIKEMIMKNNLKRPIIHIHPTSRWLFKCWKDEYMAEVLKWLLARGASCLVTSSPDEREIRKVKNILSMIKVSGSSLLDLSGKTTIKQLAAISEASDLFLGVDSAPMHIAAAVGTPVIALFGPSSPYSWGPWDNNNLKGKSMIQPQSKEGILIFGIHRVIQKDWECVPCGKDGCNGAKISDCLYDIKPEEVKVELFSKLTKQWGFSR